MTGKAIGDVTAKVLICLAVVLMTYVVVAALRLPPAEHSPVRATREHQVMVAEEQAAVAYREEEREARYAATPGAPDPVKGWEP